MSRNRRSLILGAILLFLAAGAHAQFNPTGSTTLSVNVASEAAIQINTATTTLATAGSAFSSSYTGQTSFTYKIRTGKTSGTGSITLQVTSDFAAGGPSVAAPASGDGLTYTCTVTSPGTACAGSQTARTTGSTSVATFGANARSVKAGNTGSVSWTLPNDPAYSTGAYNATVTFTISAA
ncbi:MAG: hypothetical protein LAP40_26335 [Acidobacteriia bacterium]|nr:hypothetical protein [Terriglobia bacterium]